MSRAIRLPAVPAARRPSYPTLTVIRPIKGLDPGCRENTLALLDQAYPGELQTIFILDCDDDPAWPIVSEIARTHGRANVQVLACGSPPPQRTGKLHAMLYGVERATGELLAFSDSDTRPPPHLLRLLVEELLDNPQAGTTFAPVVTHQSPISAGDVGCALLINSWYGPPVAEATGANRELPFMMGELFVLTRPAMKAIGGLQVAEGQLVDDMYLGACITRAGLKNVMVPWRLPIVTGALTFPEFMELFRRWMIFSRTGLPARFVRSNWMRGTQYAIACLATVVALLMEQGVPALFPAAAAALFVWSQQSIQARFSGQRAPLRHLWVGITLPFIGGAILLWSRINRKVVWRGRTYALDRSARLAPLTPAAPR